MGLGRPLPLLPPLEQIVPPRRCFSCDVCCRFPTADSPLRPYFTGEEIDRAVARGVAAERFADVRGAQIELVSDPSGPGYLCPAFDPTSSACGIYESRPLDCQLYPLALMWSEDGQEVVLGWDPTCPFVAEELGRPRAPLPTAGGQPGSRVPDALRQHATRIASRLEEEELLARYVQHPGLIGRYQPGVLVVAPLRRLTTRLRRTTPGPLGRLRLADRPRLETAAAETRARWDVSLACYGFAPHFIWDALLPVTWSELAGHLCLFAQSPDGLFMPLPPLGSGPIEEAVAAAFSILEAHNGPGSAVSRIESVPDALKPMLEHAGYTLRPKDPDYLYRTRDLVELPGDRYKSQRHACNQFQRASRARLEPYSDRHRDGCLALFRRWTRQQEARADLSDLARGLLADAASAHALGLAHADALGLTGLVVIVEGTLCAYTLGYPLPQPTSQDWTRVPTDRIFCILFEIADRSFPGLAAYLFREFCRAAAIQGFDWVNTMDDGTLPGLRASKQAYHPARLVGSWIATRP